MGPRLRLIVTIIGGQSRPLGPADIHNANKSTRCVVITENYTSAIVEMVGGWSAVPRWNNDERPVFLVGSFRVTLVCPTTSRTASSNLATIEISQTLARNSSFHLAKWTFTSDACIEIEISLFLPQKETWSWAIFSFQHPLFVIILE